MDGLGARYEAPPGAIERDVMQLLSQLAEEGLDQSPALRSAEA